MNPDTVRVNRDSLRSSHFDTLSEGTITKVVEGIVDAAISAKKDVIFDNTNLNRRHLETFIDKYKTKADIKFKIFDVPYEELIKRNSVKQVPEKFIKKTYNTLQEWIKEDWIKDIPKVDERNQTFVRVQDDKLTNAIICDLDGTLALLNGRNPYDASTCEQDELNEPVATIIKLYHNNGGKIVFMSGRHDTYREQTERWLQKHLPNIKYELFMRKEGDYRKDSDVKRELFNDNVDGKYFVEFVLDDRNQVVVLWRKELGLTCLQVNYGDF